MMSHALVGGWRAGCARASGAAAVRLGGLLAARQPQLQHQQRHQQPPVHAHMQLLHTIPALHARAPRGTRKSGIDRLNEQFMRERLQEDGSLDPSFVALEGESADADAGAGSGGNPLAGEATRGRRSLKEALAQVLAMKEAVMAARASGKGGDANNAEEDGKFLDAEEALKLTAKKEFATDIHKVRALSNMMKVHKTYGVKPGDWTAEGEPIGAKEERERDQRRRVDERYEEAEKTMLRLMAEEDDVEVPEEGRLRRVAETDAGVTDAKAKRRAAEMLKAKLAMKASMDEKGDSRDIMRGLGPKKAEIHSKFLTVKRASGHNRNSKDSADLNRQIETVVRAATSQVLSRAVQTVDSKARGTPQPPIDSTPVGVSTDDIEAHAVSVLQARGGDMDQEAKMALVQSVHESLRKRIEPALRSRINKNAWEGPFDNAPTPGIAFDSGSDRSSLPRPENLPSLFEREDTFDVNDNDDDILNMSDQPKRGSGEARRMNKALTKMHEDTQEFHEWLKQRKLQMKLQKPSKFLNEAAGKLGLGEGVNLTESMKRAIVKEVKTDLNKLARAKYGGRLKLPKEFDGVPRMGVRVLQIQEEYLKCLMTCFIKEPRLHSSLVAIRTKLIETSLTFTKVEFSRDLAHCEVLFVDSAPRRKIDVQSSLDRAAPWLRFAVQNRMGMKYAPEIRFILDDSEERLRGISDIIAKATAQDRKIEEHKAKVAAMAALHDADAVQMDSVHRV